MFFHARDRASLHKHLDPAYLPSNFGGQLPAIDYTGKDWFPCVKDHENHVERWNSFGFASKKA